MSDPLSAAVASAIADRAIGKLVGVMESSEDPEEPWKESGIELAIQAEAAYRQGIEAGHLWNLETTQRKLDQFGEIAQQLAIRGELKEFEPGIIEIYKEFAMRCGEFADAPNETAVDVWETELHPIIEDMKNDIDTG
jgi:hypothetical protein